MTVTSKTITTMNPYSGEILESYSFMNNIEIQKKLTEASSFYSCWRSIPLADRISRVSFIRELLKRRRNEIVELMAREMGKPITENYRELEKAIATCKYYEENAINILRDRLIETNAQQSFVRHDPIGCVFGIMPWNDPFGQVIRFAIPTLLSGNVVLLKHAPNVTGCAYLLQNLFKDAGFDNSLQLLVIEPKQVESVISHDIVQAVSFTGSTKTGRLIAMLASKYLKKCVLELGGNNACIIMDDADTSFSISEIIGSRMLSMGQNCIAAKRIVVLKQIYDEFLGKLISQLNLLRIGNPLDNYTQIGPLARRDLAIEVEKQVERSVRAGAEIIFGGKRDNNFYYPTVITEVRPGMAAFDEEIFGPVISIIKVTDIDEAFEMAANSKYGLGTMLFTKNKKAAIRRISDVPDGSFFINSATKSDPRLPFGGTKSSGIGRELSEDGILEFVNRKTVYIN